MYFWDIMQIKDLDLGLASISLNQRKQKFQCCTALDNA